MLYVHGDTVFTERVQTLEEFGARVALAAHRALDERLVHGVGHQAQNVELLLLGDHGVLILLLIHRGWTTVLRALGSKPRLYGKRMTKALRKTYVYPYRPGS